MAKKKTTKPKAKKAPAKAKRKPSPKRKPATPKTKPTPLPPDREIAGPVFPKGVS